MTIELEPVESAEPPPSRRNTVAVIGAAMLVAAAGGIGFGIGRALDDDGSAGPAAEPPAASDAVAATEPAGTDEPATDVPATEAPVTESPGSAPPFRDDVTDAVPATDAGLAAESALSSEQDIAASTAAGGPGWSMFGEQPLELMAQRTTDTGITLRAHRTQPFMYVDEYTIFDGDVAWRPPAWCSPNAELRIALGGGDATGTPVLDVGSVSWWDEPFRDRAVSWLTLGVVDGNPHRVVVVQVPAGTTSVTATFDDGNVDSAVPENGVALLVAPGGTAFDPNVGLQPPGVELSLAGPEPTTIRAEDAVTWDDPEFHDSCSPPPPALPEPGEQPADPAAAEAAIRDTVAAVYAGGEPGDSSHLIDDPSGVAEANEQVQEGQFAEAAGSAVAVVEELVFTSPTEAIYRYRLETSNGLFGDRFGAAVLVDGTWKLTRDTVCLDLGLAGGDCGGSVTPVWPPFNGGIPVEPTEAPAATLVIDD